MRRRSVFAPPPGRWPPLRAWIGLLWLLALAPAAAAELLVAVASNFQPALEAVARDFERQTGHRVGLVSGSTGKLYAQIRNGAPYDLFFSADEARPRRLESEGLAVAGSRFTYAEGTLVLWSPDPALVDAAGRVLRDGGFSRLAIANPRLAPYGLAAEQALAALGVWDAVQDRLVRGENIAQAFHFVHSGNAELGLVALAQLQGGEPVTGGSSWPVPRELHEPIAQQCVQLRDGAAAREFLDFVRTPAALAVIRRFGYAAP